MGSFSRWVAVVALASFGCSDAGPAEPDTSDVADVMDIQDARDQEDSEVGDTCDQPGDPAFDDHTRRILPTRECFFGWAAAPADPASVKFVILDVSRVPEARREEAELRFTDSAFYSLHDEWFWFRLLNGQGIPGRSLAPWTGRAFASISEVYEHFAGQTTLPLDLTRLGATGPFPGRIYSPEFYRLAGLAATNAGPAENPPFLGLGTVLHFEANPARRFPGEVWGFELEYGHAPTVGQVAAYFQMLEPKLPPEVRGQLRWITRSPAQRSVALSMKAMGHPLAERTLSYDDLVVDGRVEVYNEGIAAGYVEVYQPSFAPNDLRADRLAVIPLVPDDVPPTRAIISAVPQTALAHVNLLAKARGTPNAHIAGVLESRQIRDWDYLSTPLIFEAKAGEVRWLPITSAQYGTYVALMTPPARRIPQVDLLTAPLTVDLEALSMAEMAELVPLTGGKAAGFLSFSELEGFDTPDTPLAITVRPFVAHVAPLIAVIRAALAESDFVADPRVRFLTLEGEAAYRAANASNPAALALVGDLAVRHAATALGQILRAGGVRAMVKALPLDLETLRPLRGVLEAQFSELAPTQGLRFRSSSTAEDVPGFNGAGLYASHTGYLYPSALADPSERARTVEWALKETWASYWGYQAFEERRVGGVDHFEGAMGVVVHPRFDDVKERANLVMTFWWGDYPEARSRRLVVNVQAGSQAVTNPGGTGALPEINEVVEGPDGEAVVSRVQRSTLSPEAWILSEAELVALFEGARTHTARWLTVTTAGMSGAERPRTLVLDYELKAVHAGWPAMRDGSERPARMIWRQARVLDQAPRVTGQVDPFTPGLPLTSFMPSDLRTVAQKVTIERCDTEFGEFRVYGVLTEPSQRELFPFEVAPLMYRAWVDFARVPEGMAVDLVARVLPWTGLPERRFVPLGEAGTHRVVLETNQASSLGLDGFELTRPASGAGGRVRFWRGAVEHEVGCSSYRVQTPFQSATDYLRGLLAAP